MKRPVIIVLHIGYWLMYLMLLGIFYLLLLPSQAFRGPDAANFFEEWYRLMLSMAVVPGIIGFYSYYLWLFPRYFAKRKIGKMFLFGLLFAVIAAFFGFLTLLTSAKVDFGMNMVSLAVMTVMVPMILVAIINGVIGLVIRGFITAYSNTILMEELNKRNYNMEIALIKAKLDPHFLFNTINNIDVLIEINPEKASEYLKKLSDIMRFMLYESGTDVLPLQKEIDYISKYIELQKIRSSNSQYVDFQWSGDIDKWLIQPMLFTPFIENAFKHAENRREGNAIKIGIMASEELVFECSNRYIENSENSLAFGGLGIELMEKRLHLLYREKHELSITKLNGEFKVKLIIRA